MGQGIGHGPDLDLVSCVRNSRNPSDDAAFCRLEPRAANTAVVLNIYEGGSRANVTEVAGGGMVPFHCGVEVHGAEWSYQGKREKSSPSGIQAYKPGEYQGRTSNSFVRLGATLLSERDVLALLQKLRPMWPATAYDHLHLNAAHFCDELCKRLGVSGVPEKIMSKACAGALQPVPQGVKGLPCFCCSQRTLDQIQNINSFGVGNKPVENGYDQLTPDLMDARSTNMRRQLQQAREELHMANAELQEERAAHEEAVQMLAKLTYVVREAAQESAGKSSL